MHNVCNLEFACDSHICEWLEALYVKLPMTDLWGINRRKPQRSVHTDGTIVIPLVPEFFGVALSDVAGSLYGQMRIRGLANFSALGLAIFHYCSQEPVLPQRTIKYEAA